MQLDQLQRLRRRHAAPDLLRRPCFPARVGYQASVQTPGVCRPLIALFLQTRLPPPSKKRKKERAKNNNSGGVWSRRWGGSGEGEGGRERCPVKGWGVGGLPDMQAHLPFSSGSARCVALALHACRPPAIRKENLLCCQLKPLQLSNPSAFFQTSLLPLPGRAADSLMGSGCTPKAFVRNI
jgi:hypothetical protein